MTETQEQNLTVARHYVTDLYKNNLDPRFVFHNLDHTEDVADACSMMAEQYQLSDDDRYVLSLAAWFHDTVYTEGHAE